VVDNKTTSMSWWCCLKFNVHYTIHYTDTHLQHMNFNAKRPIKYGKGNEIGNENWK